ncbi:hypothetical protein Tco_0067207 [Tanacetum coccineum]
MKSTEDEFRRTCESIVRYPRDHSMLSRSRTGNDRESSTEIRSFLGLGDKQDESFRVLKEKLCNAPVLATFRVVQTTLGVYVMHSNKVFGVRADAQRRLSDRAYALSQLSRRMMNIIIPPKTWNWVRWCSPLKSRDIIFMGRKVLSTLTIRVSSTSLTRKS